MSKFSRAVWNELHNLTNTEKELIERFEKAASGPAFVGAADILRKRGYLDECIVILEEGLRKFSHYNSARAALGRDYYLKGLMNEARAELNVVTSRTPDNLMAQRFRLRLALVFEDRDTALLTLNILKQMGRDDEIIQSIRDNVGIDDWQGARQVVFSELVKLGVPGIWNEASASHKKSRPQSENNVCQSEPAESNMNFKNNAGTWQVPLDSQSPQAFREHDDLADTIDDSVMPRAFATGETLGNIRGDSDRYLQLRSYKLLPSSGLYAKNFADSPRHNALESSTLAEIYANQGMYLKASEIYEKLAHESPDDPALRKRCEELQGLARDDASVKPGVKAKAREALQANKSLDVERERKLKILENLLQKLESASQSPRPA